MAVINGINDLVVAIERGGGNVNYGLIERLEGRVQAGGVFPNVSDYWITVATEYINAAQTGETGGLGYALSTGQMPPIPDLREENVTTYDDYTGGPYTGPYRTSGTITRDQVVAMLPDAAGGFLLPALGVLGGLGARYGFRLLPLLGNWKVLLGAEAVDLLTPEIDLPSPSDALELARGIPQSTWNIVQEIVDVPVQVVQEIGSGVGGFFGRGGGPSSNVPIVGLGVVTMEQLGKPSWVANNIPFWRLPDGRTVVRKKDGTFKVYRQPKPIVLMPSGAGNLRTFLRADGVLDKQSKKIQKVLNRRAPKRGSRRPAPTPAAIPARYTIVSND